MTEDEFHYQYLSDCFKWRRNGKTKTWKRDSDRWEVPVKHGLYDYGTLTNRGLGQYDLSVLHPASKCPARVGDE